MKEDHIADASDLDNYEGGNELKTPILDSEEPEPT